MKKKLVFYQVMLAVAFIVGGASIFFNCSSSSNGDGGSDTGPADSGTFCSKDSDCTTGFTCQSGMCKQKQQGCTKNDQCDGGCCNSLACGACNPDGGTAQCQTNVDCKPDKICKNKGCEAPGQCINNDECPVNLVCNVSAKKCECVDNSSCDGWGFQRPYCDPVTKECREEKTCDDCDPNCKQCSDGTCSLQENKCCGDEDCTQTGSYCNKDTYECVTHQCSDLCQNDDECISWCAQEYGDLAYCSGGTCLKAECKFDPDCDAVCPTPGKNTCKPDKTCTCWQPVGICKTCVSDGDCDEAAGQICRTDPFNPNKTLCTLPCDCSGGSATCAKCWPGGSCSDCSPTGTLIPYCYQSSAFCRC